MKVIDRAPYYVKMRKGEYHISVSSDTERLDPDDAYYMCLHSSEIEKNNWSRYSNKELDQLLGERANDLEVGRTGAHLSEGVEIIKEDLPILYLCQDR